MIFDQDVLMKLLEGEEVNFQVSLPKSHDNPGNDDQIVEKGKDNENAPDEGQTMEFEKHDPAITGGWGEEDIDCDIDDGYDDD